MGKGYSFSMLAFLEGRSWNIMKRLRKMIVLEGVGIVLVMLGAGCVGTHTMLEGKTPPVGAKPPVITSYFAPEKGRFGDVLKIYVAAEAPDGEMLTIATQVTQVGYGVYPTSWITLKGNDRHRFVGYIQWNLLSGETGKLPEWTQIRINISVYNKWGNPSNEVVFPYTLVTEASPSVVLPAPFNHADIPRLGYIGITLRNPYEMGGD